MEKYFEVNRNKLKKFLNTISNESLLNQREIELIIERMIENKFPYSFDLCSFSIKNKGDIFLESISSNLENIKRDWIEIIGLCIYFCRELELRMSNGTLIPELRNILRDNPNLVYDLDVVYFAYNLMEKIITEELYSCKYNNFEENFYKNVNDILVEQFPKENEKIENLKSECNNYTNLLKGFKKEFSFLALNQAFNKLEKSKQIARIITFILLIILAGLIVYIPYFYYEKSFLINQMKEVFNLSLDKNSNSLSLFVLLGGLIPMIFIESIFIYYFKIVLNKYNSITDQIVQLETKQAIMQFIESYVDYKKDKGLKSEDLSKFEDIIFSQISPNLKDVPNSPDLVSIIEGIAKAVKTKS